MKFLWQYMKDCKNRIIVVFILKSLSTMTELLIPYVLEHIIDDVVITENMYLVLMWGIVMIILAITARQLNVMANRRGAGISRDCTYGVRRDLFWKSINLSGRQVDGFGLPSLTSRMTSDTYNIQNFIRATLAMGIRAPFLLLGGIAITLTMDVGLALILVVIAPILIALIVFVSFKGIPLYEKVQQKVDDIVRVMRENITGIRVVKALSKEDFETNRFHNTNDDLTRNDVKASAIMGLPGPIMSLFLNVGLTLVVFVGAKRVNAGLTEPGVILAFLTYFNMVLMGIMGVSRIFLMYSKANASAARIASVVLTEEDLVPIDEEAAAKTQSSDHIIFDHVNFSYNKHDDETEDEIVQSLYDISFSIKKGGSLGIIGATGCGKTTIFNLLMRFYDADSGNIFVDGRDVRTYEKDELHSKFGVVFQNDVILTGEIKNNIVFGRDVSDEDIKRAAEDACAAEFIERYEDSYNHNTTKLGANLSGGQKQRVLISRALVANPEILLLDDSSSALDYQTDAKLRKAIREHHSGTTTLVVAQRISSIMSLDEIIVVDEGRIIGRGTHEELLSSCPVYADIYKTQMGGEA